MEIHQNVLRDEKGEITAVEFTFSSQYDPTSVLTDTALTFTPCKFKPIATKKEVALVAPWGSFRGVLLSILFSERHRQRVWGTAVMVAPGIALAAWHVVGPEQPAMEAGDTSCLLAAPVEDGLVFWKPLKIARVEKSDIAILSLLRASPIPPDRKYRIARMSLRLPAIGEMVMVCGFRAEKDEFGVVGDAAKIEVKPRASTGLVTEVFSSGRDVSSMPLPCIEVDCPTKGGMSGGAAFNKDGLLIGTLSTSFDGGPSYVSLVWPALLARFDPVWPSDIFNGRDLVSLYDMDPKFCAIEGRQAITPDLTAPSDIQTPEHPSDN